MTPDFIKTSGTNLFIGVKRKQRKLWSKVQMEDKSVTLYLNNNSCCERCVGDLKTLLCCVELFHPRIATSVPDPRLTGCCCYAAVFNKPNPAFPFFIMSRSPKWVYTPDRGPQFNKRPHLRFCFDNPSRCLAFL